MTKEEKSLLLQDLCARLPYKPKVKVLSFWNEDKEVEEDIVDSVYCVMPDGYINTETIDSDISLDNIALYLRPMSSMTEEEKGELWFLLSQGRTNIELNSNGQLTTRENIELGFNYPCVCPQISSQYVDWLNAHHFDYRGLIPMGLALEAPEGMYSKANKYNND